MFVTVIGASIPRRGTPNALRPRVGVIRAHSPSTASSPRRPARRARNRRFGFGVLRRALGRNTAVDHGIVGRSVLNHRITQPAILLASGDHHVQSLLVLGAGTRALEDILGGSSFNVVQVGPSSFDDARSEFERYDDHAITLLDHLTGVPAAERTVEHVFAFDGDFRTLEFTVVPDDTSEA